jgi:hypothetical protein
MGDSKGDGEGATAHVPWPCSQLPSSYLPINSSVLDVHHISAISGHLFVLNAPAQQNNSHAALEAGTKPFCPLCIL